MALVPDQTTPKTLEDVLGQQAQSQSNNLTDQYTQAKRRAVSSEAANGRLMSGVSDYPLTDLQTNYEQGMSGIQDNLASSLAGIPSEDWMNSQNFGRSYQLAGQIGDLNKPSTLDQVFQGIGAGAGAVGMFAAL